MLFFDFMNYRFGFVDVGPTGKRDGLMYHSISNISNYSFITNRDAQIEKTH